MAAVTSPVVRRRRRPRYAHTAPAAFHRGGTGEPLVLLHGFTDTWQGWTPVLPLLEAHHEVFAPTLPGHHGGEQFAPGERMSIPRSLDLIEQLLDANGIGQAHLVGSSLGGWAALELAARGRALSVVGVCPAGGWEHGSAEERAVLKFFKLNDRMIRTSSPALLRRTAQVAALRRIVLRDLVAYPRNVSAREAVAMFEGAAGCAVVRDAIAITEAGESFGDLAPIDVPVRILYGTKDRIVRWPTHYNRMKKLLPDVEYVALDGLGHLPMWDDPQLVTRRILEVTAPSVISAT
jgi:pimeloyl-ACP methyl ester carboxylesterase